MLIDTVGFVSHLPHSLVEAFKSTLEEVKDADLLIHVVDSSYEGRDFQIEVTDKVIEQLGAGSKEKIMAYNKMDMVCDEPMDISGCRTVYVSAKTGENMDSLLEAIEEKLFGGRKIARFLIPYDKGSVTSYLCNSGEIESMEHEPEGTLIKGRFDEAEYEKYKEFLIRDM